MADFRKAEAASASQVDYSTTPEDLSTNEQNRIDQSLGILGEDERLEAERRLAEQETPEYNDLSSFVQSVGPSGSSSAGSTSSRGSSKPNPLDKYANYTYGLSLHIIPIETYNSLAAGGNYSPGSNVLIASAGRRGQPGFDRHSKFKEDFYFDNLKLTTVIGMNSYSRASNVINVSFTILEPYGISLIDRILETATSIGAQNWNQMPFMLQIDFFANTDDGQSVKVEGHTKYIPVKLIACNIKVSTKGAEYTFSAVPYNHLAFHETLGSSPAFLEVIAGTVEEFFKSDGSGVGQAGAITTEGPSIAAEKQRLRNEGTLGKTDRVESSEDYRNLNDLEKQSKQTAYKVGSYAAALNSYQKQLKDLNHLDEPDQFEFEVDNDIKDKLIVNPDAINIRSTPLATNNNVEGAKMIDGYRARLTGTSVPVTTNKQSISINAGTSVIDVINMALRNSEYLTKQVDPTKSHPVGSTPINFYKIIPEIKIGNFDKKRRVYQKTVKFYIKKFSYYNSKYPGAPRSVPTSWQKEYNYMFTGKNQSILDFNIEFNTMFYTAMTANASKIKKLDIDAQPPENDKGGGGETDKEKAFAQNQFVFRSGQAKVSTDTVGNNNVKNVGANDLYQSIMTNSRGDMINVKLKISGDPDLIKQDDYYSTPGSSIPTDASEIFAYLNFRSPSDINQDSGMYDFDSWPQSAFSGIYKILTVENVFERGQFTQTLDLVRLFEQKEDSPQSSSNRTSADERPTEELDESMQQVIPSSDRLDAYNDPRSSLFYPRNQSAGTDERLIRSSGTGQTEVDDQSYSIKEIKNLKARTANLPAQTPGADLDDFFLSGPLN